MSCSLLKALPLLWLIVVYDAINLVSNKYVRKVKPLCKVTKNVIIEDVDEESVGNYEDKFGDVDEESTYEIDEDEFSDL